MSAEYDRLSGIINQCHQQKAPGIIHKADDEDTYVAAKIVSGLPTDIQRFATIGQATRHAFSD